MRLPEPERPKPRFPRTKDPVILFIAKMRVKYPPPEYNPHYDGSWNPVDGILKSLVETPKKKLRKLCDKHSLETWGNKRRLIKRMYLHWRASTFQVGDPFVGYGKGFESTRTPTCVCGFRKRADIVRIEKAKAKMKELRKKQEIAMQGRIWIGNRRFPRLRFPRFKKKRDAKLYYQNFEKLLKRVI